MRSAPAFTGRTGERFDPKVAVVLQKCERPDRAYGATGAGDLPCRWVVHTVGPNRHRGETDPAVLASCFTRSLEVARDVGARSVAVPAVGAGVYGWAADEVADVAAGATVAATAEPGLDLVRFVLFSDRLHAAFTAALARHGIR